MSLTDIDKMSRVYSVPSVRHTALTVFAEGKAGYSRRLTQQEARSTEEQLSAGPHPETIDQHSKIFPVKATKTLL